MVFRSGDWRVAAAVLVVVVTALVPAALRAEIVVQSSTVAGYAASSRHPDDTVFDVPDGKYLKLSKESDGRSVGTFRIKGPYKGTLADYSPCPWYHFGFCGDAGSDSGESEGSLRGDGQATGATRGLKPDDGQPTEATEATE